MRSASWVYFTHRMRSEFRTALFWLVGFCVYAGLIVAVYPSVEGALNLDAMPLDLRIAFNFANFDELSGFLGAELLGVIMPILLPFFGMIMLTFAIAGAEERGRLDLILANPLPRRAIILASSATAAIYMFAIAFATGATIVIMARILDIAIGTRDAFAGTLALWPLACAFGGLAILLSATVRQRSTALAVCGALVLISYLALVIARLADGFSWLRFGSAFYFYGTAITTGFWWGGAAVLMTAAFALVAGAVVLFNRRDIYA